MRDVVALWIDLLGDGVPGVTIDAASDLRAVRGLAIRAQRKGRFRIVVGVVDVFGCTDQTGSVREVSIQ